MDWKKASHAGETFGASNSFRMALPFFQRRKGSCRLLGQERIPSRAWDGDPASVSNVRQAACFDKPLHMGNSHAHPLSYVCCSQKIFHL